MGHAWGWAGWAAFYLLPPLAPTPFLNQADHPIGQEHPARDGQGLANSYTPAHSFPTSHKLGAWAPYLNDHG